MTDVTFSTLGVPQPLVAALAAEGKTTAFPIQIDTLPDTLAGRDVLGRGKTGSGKTLAFSIPMVARLGTKLAGGNRRGGMPLGLVLAPTRELATQINAVLEPLAKAYGLTTTTIFGGVSQNRQVRRCVAASTSSSRAPAASKTSWGSATCASTPIEITVIDEADHMADLGFLPGVTRILSATPAGGQRLLFSATLDNGVDKLVKRFLQNEVLHSVDEANSPVAAMTHHVFTMTDADAKKDVVKALASGTGRRILFMRTKHTPRSSRSSSPRRASPRSTCTATSRSPRATATSRRSRRAPPGCSSRPMSPPAVCTSTTSSSSSTSTRPPSTRRTCTARAARPAPAPRVPSSRWCFPGQERDVARPAAQGRDLGQARRASRRSRPRSPPSSARSPRTSRRRRRPRSPAVAAEPGRERPAQARRARWRTAAVVAAASAGGADASASGRSQARARVAVSPPAVARRRTALRAGTSAPTRAPGTPVRLSRRRATRARRAVARPAAATAPASSWSARSCVRTAATAARGR